MHLTATFKVLGLLVMVYSFTMIPPAAIAYLYQDGAEQAFLTSFAVLFIAGLVCWLPFFKQKANLQTRDGFFVVTLYWVVLGLVGALPLMLSEALPISFTDAVFESISGLTTTGATVLTGLDHLPHSILFYRQQLQWLGGMGIIVLAVAILPMLGVGGMQLYKAEMPGPLKDNKLTPRIAETAKALWYIYLTLTIACALSFYAAGMSGFDAICHAFSTVSIGGFSTHDASMGHFDNMAVDLIASVFMFVAAINFGLHFTAWRRRGISNYFHDPEFRFYVAFICCTVALVFTGLHLHALYEDAGTTLRHTLFQTVSIATTTGFTTEDFASWPTFLPFLLLMTSFIGGCAGSTAGGMKAIRIALVFQHGLREIQRLIYPGAIFVLRFGNHTVSHRLLEAVWGFVGVYLTLFIMMVIAILMTGTDIVTAFSAVAASLNNLGPGLGDVSSHYGTMTDTAKWILAFAMLLGRLEVFTLLVLFTPMFWRQ